MNRIAIIGAGHAGSQLAVSLRQEGFGGEIVLIDAEEALPYHKPPLSKTFLKSDAAEPQPLRAEDSYREAGIIRRHARVTALAATARQIVLADGGSLVADKIVLATGARNAMIAALEGLANVFTLRTLADAKELRAALHNASRVAVIGGGFIGLETAALMAGMGKSVRVYESAPRVLGRVAAPETSALVTAALAAMGVEVRLDVADFAGRITGDRVEAIRAGDEWPVDLVLVGIGARADTTLAEAVGLAADQGLVVNGHFETSARHIYAIGDCVRFPHWQSGAMERIESVQNATDQARWLAKCLATGAAEPYRIVPWFWSDIGTQKLQIAGLSYGADERIARQNGDALAVFHLKNGVLTAVETINSPADHMLGRRLLEKGVTPDRAQIAAGTAALKALL